jgi:hypothetical protein
MAIGDDMKANHYRRMLSAATPENRLAMLSGTQNKMLMNLHQMNRTGVIVGAIGVFSLICAADFAYAFVTGHKNAPPTHNPAWAEATRAYLRSQGSNPISGISSKK